MRGSCHRAESSEQITIQNHRSISGPSPQRSSPRPSHHQEVVVERAARRTPACHRSPKWEVLTWKSSRYISLSLCLGSCLSSVLLTPALEASLTPSSSLECTFSFPSASCTTSAPTSTAASPCPTSGLSPAPLTRYHMTVMRLRRSWRGSKRGTWRTRRGGRLRSRG